MADSFLGIAGVTSRLTTERPQSWRMDQFLQDPVGDVSLTALTGILNSEKVPDPKYHWHEKQLTPYGGAITGVWVDMILTTAYTGLGVKNDILYVQMAVAIANEFRVGHRVQFRYKGATLALDKTYYDVNLVAIVVEVRKNGADSFVAVRLLEPDDNAIVTTSTAVNANRLFTIGNMNSEGGVIPEALRYRPVPKENITGITWDSLKITRTAQGTTYRTGNQYAIDKDDCRKQHMLALEDYLWWSVFCDEDTIGENGLPMRATNGVMPMIETYQAAQDVLAGLGAGNTLYNYAYDPNFQGQNWVIGGWTWLKERLRQWRKWADPKEALVYCGSGALMAIDQLAQNWGQLNIASGTKDLGFGFEVTQLVTTFGTFNLLIHPRFDQREVDEYTMAFLTPKNMSYRYIDDTFFMKDASADNRTSTAFKIDGRYEGYLTECGIECKHENTFMKLTGVGWDNDLAAP